MEGVSYAPWRSCTQAKFTRQSENVEGEINHKLLPRRIADRDAVKVEHGGSGSWRQQARALQETVSGDPSLSSLPRLGPFVLLRTMQPPD